MRHSTPTLPATPRRSPRKAPWGMIAALPLCAAMAAPAAAATTHFFDWSVTGIFTNATNVGGVDLSSTEFVISGKTEATVPFGWDGSAIEVAVDMASVSLTASGFPSVSPDFGLFRYSTLGGDYNPNNPATFRFTETASGIDFRPVTTLDAILFKTQFGGVDTWIGFGGSAAGQIGVGPDGQGAARFGITTATKPSGAADFAQAAILQRLDPGANTREATLSPIPLPASGWLLLAGLGGLAAMRRRRAAA